MLRTRHRAEQLDDLGEHFLFELRATFLGLDQRRVLQRREHDGLLTLELIGDADHGDLGDRRVRLHGFLDLAGAEAVAGDVDHVVGAPEDEVVAVVIAHGPVRGGVQQLLELAEVALHEALVVAVDRREAARRQRRHDDQHALLVRLGVGTGGFVDDADVEAVVREARRAEAVRLQVHARQVGQHRPAGLGLPVVVDDRHAERIADPARGRLIERLAGQEQVAQRREVVLAQVLRVLLLQHAHRGRRAEHRRDLVVLDDLPPDAGIGPRRQPLVDDGRHAVDQRAVDDVAVADDPADVRGREHRLAGIGVVDVLHRRGERDAVAAGVALHALRRAGGAGGVEDVARLVRLDPGHRHFGVEMLLAQRRVVGIPAFGDGHLRVEAAVDDQHVLRRVLGERAGLVDQVLVRHRLAVAHAGIGGDEQLRLRIVDAHGEVVRREAAEHHRVHGPEARAGQHREQRLGDHRHVDDDAIALADAERSEDRRGAVDLAVQLGERIRLRLFGFGRDVDQRRLIGARSQMTVDRVVAEVGLTADEPLAKRRSGIVEHLLRRLVPVDQAGLLAPEAFHVVDGSLVESFVRHPVSPPNLWYGIGRGLPPCGGRGGRCARGFRPARFRISGGRQRKPFVVVLRPSERSCTGH